LTAQASQQTINVVFPFFGAYSLVIPNFVHCICSCCRLS